MSQEALVTVLLAIGSWVVSGTITYGFMKAKIGEFEHRLQVLEADHRTLQRDFVQYQLHRMRQDGD